MSEPGKTKTSKKDKGSSSAAPHRPTGRPTGKLFLIVDNDLSVLNTIGQIIEIGGNRVLTVASAEGGMTAAGDRVPDIVFWDLHLPDANGKDGLRALLQSHPEWAGHLIATSDRVETGEVETFLRNGRILLLYKPVCIEEVQEAVGQVLAGRYDQNAVILR